MLLPMVRKVTARLEKVNGRIKTAVLRVILGCKWEDVTCFFYGENCVVRSFIMYTHQTLWR
jgi:hypothetical protein